MSQSKLISPNKSFIKNKILPEEEFEIDSRNENNFQTYFYSIMLNIVTFIVMDDLFGLEKKIRKANTIKISKIKNIDINLSLRVNNNSLYKS